MRTKTYKKSKNQTITVLSLNVARGALTHEIVLNEAYENTIDVVLIQEPYIFRDCTRRITKNHPSYDSFSPNDDWESVRPRAISYVRKELSLHTEQIYTDSSDTVALRLTSPTGKTLLLFNVYNNTPRTPSSKSAIQTLYTIPQSLFKGDFLLQGDFNLHHIRWQPSWPRSPSPGAEDFVEWADHHNIILLSPLDKATHNQGNVLDLALGSGTLLYKSTCCIASHLDATSDHSPLLTTIGWEVYPDIQPKLKLKTLDTSLFLNLLTTATKAITALPPSFSTTALDKLAESLTEALQVAYSGSTRRTIRHGKGNYWWNSECKMARREYKSKMKSNISIEKQRNARKEYRKSIKKAKVDFYKARVEEASTAKDVFTMVKWHKTRGTYRSSPLVDPRYPELPPVTKLSEKRDILLNNLLVNAAEAGDIPMDSPTISIRSIEFPPLTEDETQESLFRAGNTAPGSDEIPTPIIKLAWPLIKTQVHSLFSGCISLGHHPKIFRQAVICMLQKPNKSDLSSPRSYRPIALLSVLGKGLERLLARRIAWISIRSKILASQQFGALPCRSAIDLTTCLTHDVERALNEGKTASMLTLDIKGAFDAVLPGRLVRRLREQGWPDNLVKWISSFATDRTVQIRLDNETGPSRSISCGLPQGSPISPILFMLYISPLFKIGPPVKKFGYADDVAILATTNTLSENCSILSESLSDLLEWGQTEGITFDPRKSELQHFSRCRKDKDPSSTPSVISQNMTVSEKNRQPYTRWLGVYFDRNLSFKWHVRILTGKAMKVANALRSLANTSRGAKPSLVRQAVLACVLPTALYAAETWWPGLHRRSAQGRLISNRVAGHITLIRKVILAGARAILPVYRTTPTSALFRESGLLPPEIELNKRSRQAILRTYRLDTRHPLRKRIHWARRNKRNVSRLSRRALDHPEIENIDPLIYPPWIKQEGWCASMKRVSRYPFPIPTEIPYQDLVVYSDASCSESPSGNRVGGSVVIHQAGQTILQKCIPLSPKLSIFDAEVTAAAIAIEEALNLPTARFSNDLWILLDNQDVARLLLQKPTRSSQIKFIHFAEKASTWPNRLRLAHTLPGKVRVHWVPSHTGILGNIQADRGAKEARDIAYPASDHTPLSLDSARARNKELLSKETEDYWLQNAPLSYRTLNINKFECCPKELSLPRSLSAHIYAARSGHGDFAAYHERFNHKEALTTCSCGALKAPRHALYCTIPEERLPKVPRALGNATEYFFGTTRGAIEFTKWLKSTKFFIEVCPKFQITD